MTPIRKTHNKKKKKKRKVVLSDDSANLSRLPLSTLLLDVLLSTTHVLHKTKEKAPTNTPIAQRINTTPGSKLFAARTALEKLMVKFISITSIPKIFAKDDPPYTLILQGVFPGT